MDIEPRPLADDERAVLECLLAMPFAGVEDLRRQVHAVRVVGRCDCGCPTIYLRGLDDREPADADQLAAVESRIHGTEPPAEVLLFVRDGKLAALEYVYYNDQPPTAWPPPGRVLPVIVDR